MANVTINQVAVLSGTILMPLVGVWTADLVIHQPDGTGFDAGTAVTIATEGGIELKGIVAPDRTGDFLDAVHVRVLGGKGGMAKPVKPSAWVQPGAYVRDVVNGIAGDAGESVSSTADSTVLGTNLIAWNTMTMPAARALVTLLDVVAPSANWRILPDGTLWIGSESWPASSVTFDLIEQNPSEGTALIGIESPNVVPGDALDGVGHVNRVEHQILAGKIRSRVWVDLPQGDRGIQAAIDAMVQHSLAGVDYFGLYECKVKSQSSDGTTVDLQPVVATLPGMGKVPLRHGIAGLVVQVANGAHVLLGWDGGDPSKPYACLWKGDETVNKITLTCGDATITMTKGGNVDIATASGQKVTLNGTDHPLPKWDTFFTDFQTLLTTINTILTAGTAGSPVKQMITLASLLQSATLYGASASTYSSSKASNG